MILLLILSVWVIYQTEKYSFKEKNNYNIVGVLTLCSYIEDYFGRKGDFKKAIEHSNKIKPFTNRLAIITDTYNSFCEGTTVSRAKIS